jgi:hypothetical protein
MDSLKEGAQKMEAALRFGNFEKVAALLASGVEPSLERALSCSDARRAVELMLRWGADPNQSTYVAYKAARRAAALELLCQHGLDLNNVMCRESTPLAHAIEAHNTAAVSIMCRYGADLTRPSQGLTPVLRAIERGAVGCLQTLLNAGAPLRGDLAFHLRLCERPEPVRRVLFCAGAQLDGCGPWLARGRQAAVAVLGALRRRGGCRWLATAVARLVWATRRAEEWTL